MNTLILDCGDAIQGECRLEGYANKIEVLSYNHGIAQPIVGDPTTQKRTAGKPHHQDLTVTKHVDLASCFLTDLCNSAAVIPSVKLIVAEVDGNATIHPFITYQLSNALVSSVSVGGANGDGKPQETVTFNYTKIAWTYTGEPAASPAVNGNNPAAANPSANLVPDVVKRESKWSLEANKAE